MQPKETKNLRFDFKTDDLQFHSSEEDFDEEELEEEEIEYEDEEEEEFDSEDEDPVSIAQISPLCRNAHILLCNCNF